MEIINLHELEKKIHADAKEERFKEMVEIQLTFIKEGMKDKEKKATWIFYDKDYYTYKDLEQGWREEFHLRAVKIFEAAGGKVIGGSQIKW